MIPISPSWIKFFFEKVVKKLTTLASEFSMFFHFFFFKMFMYVLKNLEHLKYNCISVSLTNTLIYLRWNLKTLTFYPGNHHFAYTLQQCNCTLELQRWELTGVLRGQAWENLLPFDVSLLTSSQVVIRAFKVTKSLKSM